MKQPEDNKTIDMWEQKKTYTATVMISFAVEVEVEADNEDDARQLLDEKAWESYFKTTGESELYDFMEVTK
jgi:hypothetical protein